ncbi:hypothetical protein ACR9YC_07035 [Parasphingorhabdus sp. DH2-15]|uniref:tetratricopeptide repeat protein n=1 Tax=Parasphingorhabdus sp. DH2-15 TaxID=3444112 RepID=UPI003F688B11
MKQLSTKASLLLMIALATDLAVMAPAIADVGTADAAHPGNLVCDRAPLSSENPAPTGYDNQDYEKVMKPIFTAYAAQGEAVADAMLTKQLAQWAELKGAQSVEYGRTLYEMGRVDLLHDRDKEAIAHFSDALAIYKANPDTPAWLIALAYGDRSSSYHGLYQLASAEKDALAGVDIVQRYPVHVDRAVINAHGYLAAVYQAMHRKTEAIVHYRKALSCALLSDQVSPVFAAKHVSSIADMITHESNLSLTSIALIDETLMRLRASKERTPRAEISLLASKATALSKLGKDEEALATSLRAIQMSDEWLSLLKTPEASDIIDNAIQRHNLAHTYSQLGRHIEAHEQLVKMANTLGTILPDHDRVRIFMDRRRALNLIAIGKVEEGEAMLVERYRQFAATVPPTELRLIAWQSDLGNRALDAGRTQEALEYFQLAAQGIEARIAERRIDTVVSEREWEGQREVYLGIVKASAKLANAS